MSDPNKPQPSSPAPPYSYQEEDELSLVDLWNILWKRKGMILVSGFGCGLIGILYALLATEIYRAEVLMAPATRDERGGGLSALAGQFGGLASMAGVNLDSGGNVETAKATLASRSFLVGYIEEKSLKPILFEEDWNAQAQEWETENGAPPSDWRAYKRFSEMVTVSEDRQSGLVTLSVEWKEPKQAAVWTNELARRINDHLREKAHQEAERNLAFLDERLRETQVVEIRQSLYALVESEAKKAMLAAAKQDFVFEIVDPAVAPEERVKPKRSLIVLASGTLGGFLGIFLCFVAHFVSAAKASRDSRA